MCHIIRQIDSGEKRGVTFIENSEIATDFLFWTLSEKVIKN